MLPLVLAAGCARAEHELIIASTTSTQDAGLFDALIPAFEAAYPRVRVKVIAVGSGEALALGRRRDADVLLVHSPADEIAFMNAGHGRRRHTVMYNDYVIVGPPADPAGVRGSAAAGDALRRIAAAGEPFISRGDSSGTHRRELSLWRSALQGATMERAAARLEAGQGMGETLGIASERGAYTLTDRSTYDALAGALRLALLFEGDAALRNEYSVIAVAGARTAADDFCDWILSPAGAAVIRSFGVERFGRPLFIPIHDSTAD